MLALERIKKNEKCYLIIWKIIKLILEARKSSEKAKACEKKSGERKKKGCEKNRKKKKKQAEKAKSS